MLGLIYISIAKELMTTKELQELLLLCVRNNREAHVTGMLLYKDGKFLQVLEGSEDSVRERYEAICNDKRHHSIIKLFDGEIQERTFPQWTMGFRNLDEIRAESFPGFAGFLSEEPVGQVFPLDPVRANKLLRMFRHSE